MDEIKPEKLEEKTQEKIDNNPDKLDNIKKKFNDNPWMFVSIALGIVILVLLIIVFRGGITGGAISSSDAISNAVDFLNSNVGGGVEYVSHESIGNLYEVLVSYNGEQIPVYVTKDGGYLIQGVVPLTGNVVDKEETQEVEVPKSDKPKVELFIWSYCPYGVQAQGPLAEVALLLNGKADFEAVLYYDGHGEYETQQNKIQACIQEVDKDKYWDYAKNFVETVYPKCGSSGDVECNEEESIKIMKSLGINDGEVMSCVDERGDELIAKDSNLASEYGITGSPSLVINGVKVNVARNAESFKTAVCSAFNNAPEECSTTLNSNSGGASGNC